MTPKRLKQIIEGILLAAGKPLSISAILAVFEDDERPSKQEIALILASLQKDYKSRGFQLLELASGWRIQIRQDVAPWVSRLWEEKPQKYSRALLETLALIAYRQPITRGEIEEVRGVAVSTQIMRTLQERQWVKIVGYKDVPGRPAMYATSKDFLDYFNLRSLQELPTLAEMRDIDTIIEQFDMLEQDQTKHENNGEYADNGKEINSEE